MANAIAAVPHEHGDKSSGMIFITVFFIKRGSLRGIDAMIGITQSDG
ncbi:hypothetical protein KKJ04_03595 [Xenorhabdus bovienii]|nr:hypothetical protein [Xenorhabdus bovienii]